ncbi:hypothetical protein BC834DRAFT_201533 [Gloeopeniophorella convolvens]|nr:hypothetical protein BC834DRAFT_201533 [Gloeopeniophorella convolvens]
MCRVLHTHCSCALYLQLPRSMDHLRVFPRLGSPPGASSIKGCASSIVPVSTTRIAVLGLSRGRRHLAGILGTYRRYLRVFIGTVENVIIGEICHTRWQRILFFRHRI